MNFMFAKDVATKKIIRININNIAYYEESTFKNCTSIVTNDGTHVEIEIDIKDLDNMFNPVDVKIYNV